MKFVKTLAIAAVSAVSFATMVQAADIKPAVIYDMGVNLINPLMKGCITG